MALEGSFYVIGRDNRQYGPIDIATLDSWICANRISLDSQTWSPGDKAEWMPLRRLAELRAEARPPITQTERESALLPQLEMFMRRRGHTVAATHEELNSDVTAVLATAGAKGLKLALKYLTGVSVYVPSASGKYASKGSVQNAVSPLLRVTDTCGLNYGLLQLHPASGMAAFLADSLSTVDVLWRLEVCVMAALRLKEFAVAANGRNGFFMRPIILCCTADAYNRHARAISLMGLAQRADKQGTVGSYPSLVDLTRKVVLFQPRAGLFGKLQQMLEKPFGATDLDELLSL